MLMVDDDGHLAQLLDRLALVDEAVLEPAPDQVGQFAQGIVEIAEVARLFRGQRL